jgi:hypothetical protein
MRRTDVLVCRMSHTERKMVTKVAMHLDLTDSEAIRLIIREKAHEFGIRQTHDGREPRKQRLARSFDRELDDEP